ncbi:MAG: hypothetical protein HYR49_02055 [Gammaproteobacteria bacterium]|nr:hypothetical protein [Gammaproteobacteria bacterium]
MPSDDIAPHARGSPAALRRAGIRLGAVLAAVLWAALAQGLGTRPAFAEPVIGQFELKDLESDPDHVQFQSQNACSWGQPERRIDASNPSEPLFDENAISRQRHAFEIEKGFTRFLKIRIGIEFEKERAGEPAAIADADAFEKLKLAELGAEVIAVLLPRQGDGVGLGFVAEVERPIDREEPDSVILGPIIELALDAWSASLIPMAVHNFDGRPNEGGQRDNKWDLAYAAQIANSFSPGWTLTLEAYGTVERVGGTGHRSAGSLRFGDSDQHRLGPVLYYSTDVGRRVGTGAHPPITQSLEDTESDPEGTRMTIGLGFLAGLNGNTPDATLKLSIEVDF